MAIGPTVIMHGWQGCLTKKKIVDTIRGTGTDHDDRNPEIGMMCNDWADFKAMAM
jgi:hypothetical protein